MKQGSGHFQPGILCPSLSLEWRVTRKEIGDRITGMSSGTEGERGMLARQSFTCDTRYYWYSNNLLLWQQIL